MILRSSRKSTQTWRVLVLPLYTISACAGLPQDDKSSEHASAFQTCSARELNLPSPHTADDVTLFLQAFGVHNVDHEMPEHAGHQPLKMPKQLFYQFRDNITVYFLQKVKYSTDVTLKLLSRLQSAVHFGFGNARDSVMKDGMNYIWLLLAAFGCVFLIFLFMQIVSVGSKFEEESRAEHVTLLKEDSEESCYNDLFGSPGVKSPVDQWFCGAFVPVRQARFGIPLVDLAANINNNSLSIGIVGLSGSPPLRASVHNHTSPDGEKHSHLEISAPTIKQVRTKEPVRSIVVFDHEAEGDLQIMSPSDVLYHMVMCPDGSCYIRREQKTVMFLDGIREGIQLSVRSGDGALWASAQFVSEPLSHVEVCVEPGVDAMFVITCLLTLLLLSAHERRPSSSG